DLLERERLGRGPQPGQVLVQPEDAPGVEPQALPDRVTALDRGVERADHGPVPMAEPAAHVDDEVAVALVINLQHCYLPPSPPGALLAPSSLVARASLLSPDGAAPPSARSAGIRYACRRS